MITRANALAHEWIGLKAIVVKSACRVHEGAGGLIVDETKNTLVMEGQDGKQRRLPKKGCVFILELPGGEKVKIDGNKVGVLPEERPKRLLGKG